MDRTPLPPPSYVGAAATLWQLSGPSGGRLTGPAGVLPLRRRGVQLHILAPGMAKRVHNSTRFDPRQKLLRWHVEWSFVAAGVKVADQR